MEHRLGAALRSGSSVLTTVVSDNTALHTAIHTAIHIANPFSYPEGPKSPPGGQRPPAHRRC